MTDLACRVCGLLQEEAPWGADGRSPTFNICRCCGTEFGYDDATLVGMRRKRTAWLARGGTWDDPNGTTADFDPTEQMKNIPAEFR